MEKNAWDSAAYLCAWSFSLYYHQLSGWVLAPRGALCLLWCRRWLRQCRNRTERENPMELSEASPKSAQNDAHYSFTSVCYTAWAKYQTMDLPSKPSPEGIYRIIYRTCNPFPLSHCVHICLALLWNTRSCSQLVLIFAVLGVSQVLELMGLWVKWQTMVPKWRERLSVDNREVCKHTHTYTQKITLLYQHDS